MTTETAAKVAYCSKCGRASSIIGQSLDPRYPLVWCAWQAGDGEERGHHRVLGILDRQEAEPRAAADRARRLALAHPAHIDAGRARPGCPVCETNPPRPKARPHGWTRIQNRYRLASHLDLEHGDRSMLTNLNTRPWEDFAARHAELHGDPTMR